MGDVYSSGLCGRLHAECAPDITESFPAEERRTARRERFRCGGSARLGVVDAHLAASVVVVDDHRRVLLTRRADFDVWCLPGGMVDVGESLREAAERELAEEVGDLGELGRLVGVYSEIGSYTDIHIAVFAASRRQGQSVSSAEVTEVGWFARDELPADMFWWNIGYIADALDGVTGACRRVDITCRVGRVERVELYRQRDEFDGSPSEFFRWCFPRPAS